jgi:radical SAM protein with 4Fe4S-binding SPASM domain
MCAIQFRQDGPPYGPPAFMKFETFTRIVDELRGLRALHLQGLGEPMMHPRFFEMVEYANAAGASVSTNSNLTLLTPARAAQLVESGLRHISISIDGATADTYERIRTRAHFDRVVRNLEALLDAKERLRAATPALRVVTVAMRQNIDELPRLVALAAGWKAGELFVQHLCHDFQEESLPERYAPMRDFVSSQTLLGEDPARVERCFAAARSAGARLGLPVRLPRVRPRPRDAGVAGRDRCDWPWTGGYIAYDGSVMPCCMIGTPDRLNFGQVGERSFATVWSSDEFAAFRARLASSSPPSICRACAVYNGTF